MGISKITNRDLSKVCGAADTLLVNPNPKRVWLTIQNIGANNVYLKPTTATKHEPATATSGICLVAGSPGGIAVFDKNMPYYDEIRGIGASQLIITEAYFDD